MSASRHLAGLPVKPALRNLFLWGWYQDAHGGRLPCGRAHTRRLAEKRGAVILRWWRRLPADERRRLSESAAGEIQSFNSGVRQARVQLQSKREESALKIARLRYKSHRWTSGLASGPADPPGRVTYCADCGCEDQGDPAEFPELVYPVCEDAP